MTRTILRLAAAALLLAPMTIAAAQAQQSSPDRDPADSRIQGTVKPMTPMGSAGNRPVGRAIGRIGGNDEWVDRGGETSRAQEPARRPSALGNSGLPPSQGRMLPDQNNAFGTIGGNSAYGRGTWGPPR